MWPMHPQAVPCVGLGMACQPVQPLHEAAHAFMHVPPIPNIIHACPGHVPKVVLKPRSTDTLEYCALESAVEA